MKKQSDIDQFFKKRLDTKLASESDWNLPGDEVWEAAKVHFPKKKKKRFPFFLLFSGLGLVLLLLLNFNPWNNQAFSTAQTNSSSRLSFIQEPNSDHRTSQISSATVSNESITKKQKNEAVINNSQPFESSVNENWDRDQFISSDQNNQKSIARSSSSANKNTTDGNAPEISTPASSSELKSSAQDLHSMCASKMIKDHDLIKNQNNTGLIPTKRETSKLTDLFTDDSHEAFFTTKSGQKSDGMKFLDFVSLQPLRIESTSISQVSELNIVHRRPLRKWEIGLSHAPFVFNPFNVGEVNLESGEHLHLKSTYRNLNFNIARRLSQRFSLSSGASWSDLDVKMNFSFRDEYNMGQTSGKFQERIEKNTAIGSLTINDASSDIQIEFIPGSDVVDGDTLQVIGFLPIKLTAYQVPLLLNYHFRSRRIGWMIQSGVSLDVIRASLDHLELDAYKDGRLVTEPVIFTPLQETGLTVSAYVGGGFKYYIGNHINIGISAKIDVTGLIFSRYDIGINYGF